MFFLDTNIPLYAFGCDEERKKRLATEIMVTALEKGTGIISTQVIREFMHVALSKSRLAISFEQMRDIYISTLLPLCRFDVTTPALYEKALHLKERYQFSFYDSLIVAAAVLSGCDTLYTEDLQDGQTIEMVRIVNPFLN